MLLILPLAWCCAGCLGYPWLLSPPFFWNYLKSGFSHVQWNLYNSTLLACSLMFFRRHPSLSGALHDSHGYVIGTMWPSYNLNTTLTWMRNKILLWDFLFVCLFASSCLRWVLQKVTYPKSHSKLDTTLGLGWKSSCSFNAVSLRHYIICNTHLKVKGSDSISIPI